MGVSPPYANDELLCEDTFKYMEIVETLFVTFLRIFEGEMLGAVCLQFTITNNFEFFSLLAFRSERDESERSESPMAVIAVAPD